MRFRKIAFVLTSLRKGGAEGKAQKIIKALSPHFHIELFLFNKVVEYELPPEVTVHALGSRFAPLKDSWLQLPIIFLRLIRLSRQNKLDITYASDYLPNLLCVMNKVLGWTGKVIINQVNNSQLELKTYHVFKSVLIKMAMRRLYPCANHIIVPSRGLKQDLEKLLNIKNDLVSYVPNPIDLKEISQLSKETLSLEPATSRNFIFIHVGNLRPAKNHALLLHAFAKLQHPNCELWLIGKGTDSNTLKELILELGIENQVRTFGKIKNPIPFMLRSNCMILCSDYEGSPNVIVEGLACKLPIIATDCAYGPREILSTSAATDADASLDDIEIVKHGILVPTGKISTLCKAMNHSANSPELMAAFAELAFERILPLDIERNVKTYIEFIR